MDRNKNSGSGRKKTVSGSASVHKRGSGLNNKKPVGKSDAYKDRQKNTISYKKPSSSGSSNSTQNLGNMFNSQSNQSYSSNTSSGNYQKQTSSSPLGRIITIAIIVIVAYFLLRSCMGNNQLSTSGFDTSGYESISSGDTPSANTDQSASTSVDYSVSNDARDKYTTILGDGQDEITIMVYMCGSDLESRSGMATADLQEMLYADIAGNVNIVVETGGASQWKNSVISPKTNQRYQITADGLVPLEENLGRKSMTDPDTLVDFIEYCEDNFEANRYILIFWDHGGGSNQGFGHDEFYPRTTMTLDEIDDALHEADVKFDLVGFDACLMATYETAIMLEGHADYMIASEETEPSIGWYYTNWLTKLSQNTSMSTVDIGKTIIDDFTAKCYQASPRDKTTLSIIDLSELAGTVPKLFNAFASTTGELIDSDNYEVVSDARAGSREFGSPSPLNQIDLIHLCQNIGTDEALELVKALDGCIKYNRTSDVMSNSNGISIYFPYTTLSTMGSMIDTYEKIGMDKAYTDCIRGFASLEVGGQAISTGSSNPLGSLFGNVMQQGGGQLVGSLLQSFIGGDGLTDMLGSGNTSWVDTDTITNSTDFYEENYVEDGAMQVVEKDGGYVLQMSDKDWDLMQTVLLNVFLDDGAGYIDLGLDNVYQFDDDGDLMIDYDGSWLALNGQVVAYYFLEEEWQGDKFATVGRVPAYINNELVDIMIAFTNDVPDGEVLGARLVYDDGTTAKGLMKIKNGDAIDFICDYYTYDQQFEDSYYLGDQMIVNGGLEVSYVYVEDITCLVTYMLTDMYNNTYWTPAIEYR